VFFPDFEAGREESQVSLRRDEYGKTSNTTAQAEEEGWQDGLSTFATRSSQRSGVWGEVTLDRVRVDVRVAVAAMGWQSKERTFVFFLLPPSNRFLVNGQWFNRFFLARSPNQPTTGFSLTFNTNKQHSWSSSSFLPPHCYQFVNVVFRAHTRSIIILINKGSPKDYVLTWCYVGLWILMMIITTKSGSSFDNNVLYTILPFPLVSLVWF